MVGTSYSLSRRVRTPIVEPRLIVNADEAAVNAAADGEG